MISVHLEKVADGRWLVQDTYSGKRLGEVFGGNRAYQAHSMKGRLIGIAPSKRAAAVLLKQGNGARQH